MAKEKETSGAEEEEEDGGEEDGGVVGEGEEDGGEGGGKATEKQRGAEVLWGFFPVTLYNMYRVLQCCNMVFWLGCQKVKEKEVEEM